eukprot:13675312-Ditylum_brightwellii.AAC.1
MSWKNNNLHFLVYSKENQTIKYVNKESCHRTLVFKAVPAGVFTWIGQLTLLTQENENTSIMELYPLHAAALNTAKLLPKKIPTVSELYQQEDDRRQRSKKKEEEKEKKRDDMTIYFVVGHSRFWKKFNIMRNIQRLKKRFNLTYLRFSMAYRHL